MMKTSSFLISTWKNYHCPNYIYEEMVCPKCDSMLYYNDVKKICTYDNQDFISVQIYEGENTYTKDNNYLVCVYLDKDNPKSYLSNLL